MPIEVGLAARRAALSLGLFLASACSEGAPSPEPLRRGEAQTQAMVRVLDVTDGDTVRVTGGPWEQERVRLAGIDAPELSQAWGPEATEALEKLVAGRDILLVSAGRDKYSRLLGDLWAGDKWLNLQLVEDGHSWWYRKYSDSEELSLAEQEAKQERRGLWQEETPQPPWEFRNGPTPASAGIDDYAASDTAVFLTRTGTKYHRGSCRFLARSKLEVDREQAEANYAPCSVCNP